MDLPWKLNASVISVTCPYVWSVLPKCEVLVTVPLRALLDQFAPDFPGFCKVGTGHNKKIDFKARGFIAVTDSVRLLKKLKFATIFVDEAHRAVPGGLPQAEDIFLLSATHKEEPDFRYSMGQGIENGVLCDYDITVPAVSEHHAYICLADLLLKQVGRFRRVLAYCNSVAEAKRFQMVLQEVGLEAWHINARTPLMQRATVMRDFTGPLLKPVHVLVTVEVLGEGINIPNADTCMFVEPRNSYRSIIQAIGRVLRHHPSKALAHIVLPAVALQKQKLPEDEEEQSEGRSQLDSEMSPSIQDEPPHLHAREGAEGETKKNDIAPNQPHRSKSSRKPNAEETRALKSEQADTSIQFRKAYDDADLLISSDDQSLQIFKETDDDTATARVTDNTGAPNPATLYHDLNVTGRQGGRMEKHSVNHAKQRLRSSSKDIFLTDHPDPETNVQNSSAAAAVKPADVRGVPRVANAISFFQQYRRAMQQADDSLQTKLIDQADVPNFRGDEHFRSRYREMPRRVRFNSNLLGLEGDYDGQVERFLAMLVRADDRLVGSIASHRVQIVDCSLQGEGEIDFDTIHSSLYRRLTAILSQSDPWEIRFQSLEDFCEKHGRLPSRLRESAFGEKKLGTWLANQNCELKHQRMLVQRMNKFLNSSHRIIRRRAEGWATGDRDGRFQERCAELKRYLQEHSRLPSGHPLAGWLQNQRSRGMDLNPQKRKMLQSVHPFVARVLERWAHAREIRIDVETWERRLQELDAFVWVREQLPRQIAGEASLSIWFQVQRRRIYLSILPLELRKRFQGCHPLIAAAAHRAWVNAKKTCLGLLGAIDAGDCKPEQASPTVSHQLKADVSSCHELCLPITEATWRWEFCAARSPREKFKACKACWAVRLFEDPTRKNKHVFEAMPQHTHYCCRAPSTKPVGCPVGDYSFWCGCRMPRISPLLQLRPKRDSPPRVQCQTQDRMPMVHLSLVDPCGDMDRTGILVPFCPRSAARRPKRDEPCSGPIPSWVYEGVVFVDKL